MFWAVAVALCLISVNAMVVSGADIPTPTGPQLDELFELLAGKRVAMMANPTSVDEDLNFLPDRFALDKSTPFNLTFFFACEHGLRGDAQAGATITDYVDSVTGKMVYSLYGPRRIPTPEMFDQFDVLLFDMQDVGARFYTFVWSMTYVLEAAAKAGKTFVVFDRPNPTGLAAVDGPPNTQDAGFLGRVFPGQPFGVATRHGMTVGEIATLVNEAWTTGPKADLHVVKVHGLTRDMGWADTGRPWVMPSPNIPTWEYSAAVYPGFGLFESTGLSEGRGTTRPFEIIGAPFFNGPAAVQWAEMLNERVAKGLIPGAKFRTTFFTPTFSKWVNVQCGGIQVYITDIKQFDPIVSALEVLKAAVTIFPQNVTVNTYIDTEAGIAGLHNTIFTNTVDSIVQSYQSNLAKFIALRNQYLLY